MQGGEKYREGISKGERERGKKGELGGRGRKRGRKRERERISKQMKRKPPLSHYNSFPQDTLYSFQSGPSFYPICLPLLCPLIFTYPPELHLCLEHTVTIKDNVDMKLREKNYRGSNNPRSSEQVIKTEKQASGVIPTSTGQPDNPDLTALPSSQRTMEPTCLLPTTTLPVRL